MDTLLKMAAALAIILAALSMFSSLSWLMRLRILAVIAFGMIAVGLLTWSATGQWGPDGIVTFPSFVNSLILLFSAFASGFIAYFIAALNHDVSVSMIIDPHKKIQSLLKRFKG